MSAVRACDSAPAQSPRTKSNSTQLHLGENVPEGKLHLRIGLRYFLEAGFQFGQVRLSDKFEPGSGAEAKRDGISLPYFGRQRLKHFRYFDSLVQASQELAMPDAELAVAVACCHGGDSDPASCSLRSPSAAASFNLKKCKFTIERAPSTLASSFGSESFDAISRASRSAAQAGSRPPEAALAWPSAARRRSRLALTSWRR